MRGRICSVSNGSFDVAIHKHYLAYPVPGCKLSAKMSFRFADRCILTFDEARSLENKGAARRWFMGMFGKLHARSLSRTVPDTLRYFQKLIHA